MKQRVDYAMTANHPNLALLDKQRKTTLPIDVTCSMDVNMVAAATTKHKKYGNLEIAMIKQYKFCKIQTVPIVIGALGTSCQNFDTSLVKVSPLACAATIQEEILLGTSHILQHVLTDTVLYPYQPI
eukprot:13000386-Ditylum_brightwellii.AAC.1